MKLVTESGAVAASYEYDAWGNILSQSGSMADANPLRYRGYYYDSETGFYYLQSRYYDPAMHRFINADSYASTGQGFIGTNMFAYCHNSPVAFYDTEGNMATEATIAATNWWNPIGWFFAAVAVVEVAVVVVAIADNINDAENAEKLSNTNTENSLDTTPSPPTPPNGDKNGRNNKQKSENKTPRNNQAQNKQVRSIVKKLKLTKNQQRELHDTISGQGFSYQEIFEIACDIAGGLK